MPRRIRKPGALREPSVSDVPGQALCCGGANGSGFMPPAALKVKKRPPGSPHPHVQRRHVGRGWPCWTTLFCALLRCHRGRLGICGGRMGTTGHQSPANYQTKMTKFWASWRYVTNVALSQAQGRRVLSTVARSSPWGVYPGAYPNEASPTPKHNGCNRAEVVMLD